MSYLVNTVVSIAAVAGLSQMALAQTPTTPFRIDARWVLDEPIAPGGATAVSLTLQARVTYLAPLPENTSTRRWGNYGVWGLSYGPQGASQPATIRATGPVTLRRGDWGVFTGVEESGEPTESEFMRGAAPGRFTADPFNFQFGFRNFGPPATISSAINDATGNGAGINDWANGYFEPDGRLTRFDFTVNPNYPSGPAPLWSNPATGFNVDPVDGGPAWENLYRIGLVSTVPLVQGDGAVVVTFDGWLRPMIGTGLVGGTFWGGIPGGVSVNTGTSYELALASMRFGLVPAPGAAAAFALAGVVVLRRRRSASSKR